jgi:hypothetical protein
MLRETSSLVPPRNPRDTQTAWSFDQTIQGAYEAQSVAL